jgi:hypothetical protein
MTIRKLGHAARWAFLLAATLFVAGVFPFTTHPANGQAQGALVIAAAPIANLSDGAVVKVHAESTGLTIYSLSAHVCMPGKVNGDHAFDFAGPFCVSVPIGQGEVEKVVSFPGVNAADLEMKVGTGSVEWHNTIGYPYSLTCGPGNPCDLVVRAEITNATAYFQVPLCFGTGCPAAAPLPSNPTAHEVSPPPTPTTEPPPATTTTAAPAAAAPAAAPPGGGSNGAAPKAAGTGTSHSSTSPSGDLASAQSTSAISIPPEGPSRGVRVFVAALVGALGGARIVQVVSRARKGRGPRLGTA